MYVTHFLRVSGAAVKGKRSVGSEASPSVATVYGLVVRGAKAMSHRTAEWRLGQLSLANTPTCSTGDRLAAVQCKEHSRAEYRYGHNWGLSHSTLYLRSTGFTHRIVESPAADKCSLVLTASLL